MIVKESEREKKRDKYILTVNSDENECINRSTVFSFDIDYIRNDLYLSILHMPSI